MITCTMWFIVFGVQDVYSTFSSDSGNVADYYDSSDRPPLHHPLPKSRSMPDYMENYAGRFGIEWNYMCVNIVYFGCLISL